MKKIILSFVLCFFGTAAFSQENVAQNSRKNAAQGAFKSSAQGDKELIFTEISKQYEPYPSEFVAFDKGAEILQSYEKLAKIHAQIPVKRGFAGDSFKNETAPSLESMANKGLVANESAKSETAASGESAKNAVRENDFDGCACDGLVPKIEPYKDFHHKKSVYIWEEKRLIIKRECWGAGFFYFELEKTQGGTKITAKFTRDAF